MFLFVTLQYRVVLKISWSRTVSQLLTGLWNVRKCRAAFAEAQDDPQMSCFIHKPSDIQLTVKVEDRNQTRFIFKKLELENYTWTFSSFRCCHVVWAWFITFSEAEHIVGHIVWNWITWISKKTKTESGSVRSVGVLECEHLRCLSIRSAAEELFQHVCQGQSCLFEILWVRYCIFNVQLTETSLWIMTLYFKSKGGTNMTLLYSLSTSGGGGGRCRWQRDWRRHRTAAPVSLPTNSQWSGSCF